MSGNVNPGKSLLFEVGWMESMSRYCREVLTSLSVVPREGCYPSTQLRDKVLPERTHLPHYPCQLVQYDSALFGPTKCNHVQSSTVGFGLALHSCNEILISSVPAEKKAKSTVRFNKSTCHCWVRCKICNFTLRS